MLDLVRLSPRPLFPPGGQDLYRQIALLTEMGEDDEVLDVASGPGISLEYFVREYGVHGSGVERDSRLVEQAEARARDAGLATQLQFQTGSYDALPYRDGVFDVAIGELGLAGDCTPADAVRELVRVTKPGGTVVLVQLVWKALVDEHREQVLSEHLGTRPLMLVEWKRFLKDAGVVGLHAEDWADEKSSFRSRTPMPFPDFAEIFTMSEKVGILRRAWRRWGWRGVRAVLEREREIHRLLTRERILGLDLIKGRKPAEPVGAREAEAEEGRSPQEPAAGPEGAAPAEGVRDAPENTGADDGETAGLPLFGKDEER